MLDLKAWTTLRAAHDSLHTREAQVLSAFKLTSEQFWVIKTIKNLGQPTRITDIARPLLRSTNSVSMIIDRMVTGGLVRRVRDKRDRRTVLVYVTDKGERTFQAPDVAHTEFIQTALSRMSDTDKRNLIGLLEMLR